MSSFEFEVIAELISSREPTKTAARMVLVDGLRPADAARECDLLPQSVNKTLRRFEEAESLILDAYSPIKNLGNTSCNKPLKVYNENIPATSMENAMTNRSPILTNNDHRLLDDFLSTIFDDIQKGAITKDQVMGGLAQVIAAIDKGNRAEAVNWFKQGRKLIRLAV